MFQLPFSTFMMRISFESVPRELDEAAMVDGCSPGRVLWRVLLPAVKPGLITVGLFAFLAAWNDFFAPLILINDSNKMTLPLAVSNLRGQVQGVVDYGATEAGVVVLALPCILLFLLLQRHYVRGFMSGALQGMTMTPPRPTDATPSRRAVHRGAAPARPRRGAHHRRLLGRAPGRQRPRDPRAHRALAGARGLARQLRPRRRPARLPEGRRGREFSDSEVYKFLEAMAWEIGRRATRRALDELEARFRAVVARVAAAQEPDGYLNTQFGRPGQQPR